MGYRAIAAASALAMLLAASPAQAEDEGPIEGLSPEGKTVQYRFLPEERWGRLSTRKDFNRFYYLEGRWKYVHGDGIRLHNAQVLGKPTDRFLKIQQGALKSGLAGGVDAKNNKLEKHRSPVRIFGQVKRRGRQMVVEVYSVLRLPNEDVQFRKKLKSLGSDVTEIAKLRQRCIARAKRFDDDSLRAVAREITRREMEIVSKQLGKADYEKKLAMAIRYKDELKDRDGAISMFASIVEDRNVRRSKSKKVKGIARTALRMLGRLRAVRRRGSKGYEWVTEEDFKRKMGYISRGGAWVRQERAELEDHRRKEIGRQSGRLDPPRINEHQLAKEALAGRIKRGQFFQEVARALGLPKTVYHMVKADHSKKKVVWSQWIMEDGSRIYFLKGEVISKVRAGTPWPLK